MGLSEVIARARSASQNTRSSTGWSPSDPVPAGFSSSTSSYSLPVSSFSTLEFETDKAQWSKGTVLFTREQTNSSGLPAYGAPALDVKEQIGEIKVQLEARSNSESLLKAWRVQVIEEDHVVGLKLETSDSSPLAAALSFHLTFILPASLTGLNALRVDSNRFRLLFDPSLASNFSIASLSLQTTDAPIQLSLTNAGDVRIRNENVLDPNKGGIKTTEPLISGSLQAEKISFEVQDGEVRGQYTSTVGAISVTTTNFPISGSFAARTTLHLSTTNSTLSGDFTALAPPSINSSVAGITIETAQGKVECACHSPSGVRVTTRNAPITGSFAVGGLLVLNTTHFKIDSKIRLLSPSSNNLLPDTVVGSPSPSVLSAGSTEPPSFHEALRQGAGSSGAAGGTSRVKVLAETTEGAVSLDFEEHPADVVAAVEASTTRGGKIAVKHLAGWEGSFSASTSLASTASLDFPPSAPGTSSATPQVNYTTKKRSEIVGTVGNGGNSTRLVGTNSVDIIVG